MNSQTKTQSSDLMRDVIQRVAVGPNRGRDIALKEAELVMQAILDGQIDEVQAAVFLIALRMKSESFDECRGLFNAMKSRFEPVKVDVAELICLADPFDGYLRYASMSPFLPAVLAACDFPALIHGVESVGPKHGVTACKVYRLAGMNVFHSSEDASAGLQASGWAYVDQSQYAADFFVLADLRDRIVKRTALTTLERLLMPIRAREKTHLALGYVHKAYPQIYASIAQLADYDSALLLKGLEGGLMPALNKPLRRYFFDESCIKSFDFEDGAQTEARKEVLELERLSNLDSGGLAVEQESLMKAAEFCLESGLAVLAGKSGLARDSLCLSAAHILDVHHRVPSISAAVDLVHDVLDSGKALSVFNQGISI